MGTLLVLDGLDGSGKSTQLQALDRRLTEEGRPHRVISFPDYREPSSALVRMYLAGEFGTAPQSVNAYAASSFYAVDRYASYKRFWEQPYTSGEWIIAARYTTSNAIHQMSKLPREEWDNYLLWLYRYEYRLLGLPEPNAVIFLDMPTEMAQQLLVSRYGGDEGKKDIHERDVRYLQDCRAAALYAAAQGGWKVIPCARGNQLRSVEDIAGDIAAVWRDLP